MTICTHQRQPLFGHIDDGCMMLNDAGQAAQAHWQRLARHFNHIRLDAFVVMPNHIHAIIEIVKLPDISVADDADGPPPTSGGGKAFCEHPTPGRGKALSPDAPRFGQEKISDNASPLRHRSIKLQTNRPHGTPPGSIGAIIGNYKSVSTRQINRLRRSPGNPVWQRNYHDHIIRNQPELDNARIYIQANPQNWAQDRLRQPI
ncbi:MAG: transposase [Cyanobacteria bacterium J06607_6]